MEERRQIVNTYVQQGLRTSIAFSLAGFARSSYYYKPKPGKGGRKPSTHTLTCSGEKVCNSRVVELMACICLQPFIDYGCGRMYLELKKRGLIINKKKVYRLMKDHKLLYPKKGKGPTRQRVNCSSPKTTQPFEVIELDIKYVYIHGEKRNAYLLTALDTFTRIALAWSLEYQMKAVQVADLAANMLKGYDIVAEKEVTLWMRTDNGPQFISAVLKEAIKSLPFRHEFIQPRTPQQNGHIESFHHTVSKLVTSGYEFEDLKHAKTVFESFYHVYNHERIMTELLGNSPMEFYGLWQKGKIGIRREKGRNRFFFKEKPDRSTGLSFEDFLVALQSKIQVQSKSTPLTNSVQLIGG